MITNTPLMRNTKRIFVVVGVLLLALLTTGIVADVMAFDRTDGGYEPPYTDYTGEPIDWTTVETTRTGMHKNGYVLDVRVNCTSGMMHFDFFGIGIPFRKFSPRAIAVHKPREACQERGFTPEF